MAHILSSNIFNNIFGFITSIAFTTVTLIPPPLMATNASVDFKAINLCIRIGKIVEKIKTSIENGHTNKIVSYMFDIKNEVEQHTGRKIDINQQIDLAQKQAKLNGHNIDAKYIKQIKKDFKKEDKRRRYHVEWFAQCSELNIPYSTVEADLNFEMNYEMDKKGKIEEKDIDVPLPVMVGITISLCGLFLFFVPLPFCMQTGTWLIGAGVEVIGYYTIDKWDEYDRDQKCK